MKNPNCDGDKCRYEKGEVRLLPTGGDSNAILCHACYEHEIKFRKQRNKTLSKESHFELPSWKNLKIYPEAQS